MAPNEGGTMEALGWVFVGVLVLFVLLGLLMVLRSFPDLRRYGKIRSM